MCKLVSIPWEESDYALVMTPRNIKQRRKNSSQGSGSSERDEDDPEERAQNLQKLNDIMIDLAALDSKLKNKGVAKSSSASGQGSPRDPASSPREPAYPPPPDVLAGRVCQHKCFFSFGRGLLKAVDQ